MGAEDHTRTPLDAAAVQEAVVRPGGLWRAVEVTEVTGSTNADLLARAAGGAPEGLVLAAEEQRAGRGRMERAWVCPPRAGLTFSLLVRPGTVPPGRRGWLALLAGVAVGAAVRAVARVHAELKWPNDVLASASTARGAAPAKLAGILAEAAGDAVVVGIGLNVSTGPAELDAMQKAQRPGALPATSLAALGWARQDRAALLAEILTGFERRYRAWRNAAGDPDRCGLRAEYLRACGTLARQVRVELPAGQLSGLAVGVDPHGRLLLRVPSGAVVPVAAGDVVHLR
jgi:BirA family biotin operon repressor/biotin-[acetyl-CoA-carboxylase] ligase